MKRVKTADLTGPALDWVVAKANGITPIGIKKKHSDGYFLYPHKGATIPLEYSSKWAQGGPLVDVMIETHGLVFACRGKTVVCSLPFSIEHQEWFGATPLIAAMRCFVTKALGAEVDVPEELLCSNQS